MSSPARLVWVVVRAAFVAMGGGVGYRVAGGSWAAVAAAAFISFVVICSVDLLSHRGEMSPASMRSTRAPDDQPRET